MCGITGIISSTISKEVRDRVVLKMNQDIHHRGPDEDGFFSDARVSLAMKRLSIIDLTTGKQPIYANDGKTLIFFNGEIYNYHKLRDELITAGFTFETNSDTEVIVNLFQRDGIAMIAKLRGMFAFCIYNIENHNVYIGRDRFGEKPLFYYHKDETIIFASELASLFNTDLFPKKINEDFLRVFLNRSFVPDPFTLVENVYSLAPGNYFSIVNGKMTIETYYKVSYQTDYSIKSIHDASEYIYPFLNNAVKRQMVADVPYGAFLSGGIDSSSIVALMQQNSMDPIKTFTVKFNTKGYDESKIARQVADRLHTNHHEIELENSGFSKEIFWKIIRHVGTPFPDSSAIPTDRVTSEIVKHVKVALSGDGGDEIFGGYNVFDWYQKLQRIKQAPRTISTIAVGILTIAEKSNIAANKIRQFKKAIQISKLDDFEMLIEMHALFQQKEINQFYKRPSAFKDNIPAEFTRMSVLRKAMYYRLTYNLPLDMLVKVDRMSMSNSLEVRAPLLDHDLAEASMKIPDHFMRKDGIGKLILRNIMKDVLPYDVFNHPKSGFSIPLHDFQNKEFKELAEELIINSDLLNPYFNKEALKEIVYIGLNDKSTDGKGSVYRKTHQLWSLMMLAGWMQLFKIK